MGNNPVKFSYKQIWFIAYPILISLVMEQLIGMTDTAFMGRVGEVELGASAIAGVYYMIYCRPREYHGMLALFWAIMGGIWIYELLVKHASLERTGQHNAFAVLLLVMPLIYPLCSLALGHEFPIMTSPVMPCSVAVFTIGLMLAFSERVNIVLAMFLCHWALIGLSKVYFFGIPEDYLLACSTIPALYIFFREYVRSNADRPMKPSAHVLDALLITLCLVIGIFFTFTLLHQLDLFTRII